MELDEINPIALVLALIGGFAGFIMVRRMEGIQLMWKVLTPILTFVACFFLVQKMADN